ncbi:MAG: hypothetical protein SNJ33_06425 [Rikenellaceae bacterium]
MQIIKLIYVAISLVVCTSCIDRDNFWLLERPVVKIGENSLFTKDIISTIPSGLNHKDSLAFVSAYMQRWSKAEVKKQTAEKMFSSDNEIERLVEDYRRKLLADKLDKHIIVERADTLILESQIRSYYNKNISQFKVEKPLVKFKVLCYSTPYSSSANLLKLFSSEKSNDRDDLQSICEKNLFNFSQMDDSWYDFKEVFTLIPPVEQSEYETILTNDKVQTFSKDKTIYYLKILSYCNIGDDTPIELTESRIRNILLKERENQILLKYEDELYHKALNSGKISFPSTSHIR